KTPMERYCELMEQTPLSEDVAGNYHPEREHIQEQNYSLELRLRKLK
ncbi:IS481 family transposase, partial [Adlercreutzia equolifaciens]|nr:IS481 family transposase [Adlercreutzia equolifaciens]